MAKAPAIKKINPDKIPLTTRVYCASKIIQIYESCNMTLDSKTFQQYKKEYEQKLLDVDIDTIEMLNKWGVLDSNYQIKSDELLLDKLKEYEAESVISDLGKTKTNDNSQISLLKYAEALLPQGVNNLDDLKTLNNDTQINKIKEMLAEDFAIAKLEDPDNELLQVIEPKVNKQIADLPFFVVLAEEDVSVNHDLYDIFDDSERGKFLTFMGNMLWMGQELTNSNKELPSYLYDNIRKDLENPELTNEEIATVAKKSYRTAVDGCWYHKQKYFKDDHVTKEKYIENCISPWISQLMKGNTGFKALAFLNPKEQAIYDRLSEKEKRRIESSHITVHHKIDRKYHVLLKSWINKKLLNKYFNLELIIDKDLHDNEHKGERKINIKGKDYWIVKINKDIDCSLLCAPGNEACSPKAARKTAIKSLIPEPIKELVSQKQLNTSLIGKSKTDTVRR